jgi:hypothetical protein
MRYRLLATYRGAPYEAGVGPEQTGVVLFAACPPPEDLGFEPATGHWRKEVARDDVHALYESRPVGIFGGERCVVLDDLTDRLHIAYLGHDAFRAEQLGYWEVDRGVFELITPRQEVTEIVEQRISVAVPDQITRLPDVLSGPAFLTSGRTSQPADDEHPLPLEAQAMRAARKAKKSQPESPARLSEPSSTMGVHADNVRSVPSWSPQAVTPHPAVGQPAAEQTGGQRPTQVPDHADPDGASAGGSVVTGGFVAGVSPAVAPTAANGQNQPAGAGTPEGPFIGSAPVPQPGPSLPGAAQVNGTHHGQANAQVLRPSPGLPRDQLERPVTAMAAGSPPGVAGPAAGSSPSGADARVAAEPQVAGTRVTSHASSPPASVGEVAAAAATPGVGVAVADHVHPMPYPAAGALEARLADAAADPSSKPAEAGESEPMPRRRRASRRRQPTQRIFSELAAQAGILPGAYAINDDVEGAMCLVRTGEGFEVFNSLAGARHEVRLFQDEESAYFYLFGLLAAEAVRTGALRPRP